MSSLIDTCFLDLFTRDFIDWDFFLEPSILKPSIHYEQKSKAEEIGRTPRALPVFIVCRVARLFVVFLDDGVGVAVVVNVVRRFVVPPERQKCFALVTQPL